jgi:hypothetical protein
MLPCRDSAEIVIGMRKLNGSEEFLFEHKQIYTLGVIQGSRRAVFLEPFQGHDDHFRNEWRICSSSRT